ncbi:uncharacterized protein G2W53_008241 [Senna tora]|uniref:Uncharacterized protein n=1 Tax=Senna tora TaxID=362788 RepID=A0A835CF12_9FABA|nr:uncharacterized protein G2W53_008241 [Senna tora]
MDNTNIIDGGVTYCCKLAPDVDV